MNRFAALIVLLVISTTQIVQAQAIEKVAQQRLQDFFGQQTAAASIQSFKLTDVRIDYPNKQLNIYLSDSFSYQPFTPETVEKIYADIKKILPGPICFYQTTIWSDGKRVEELIPNFYLKKKEKDQHRLFNESYRGAPWVENESKPYRLSQGLQGKHIALWQSHGKYFRNEKKRWEWQRPPLFCTTEDLFTQSFVIPYLIPMLERAGAYVYTPRERDTQVHEVLVDNDTPNGSVYLEKNSRKAHWQQAASKGFAYYKQTYIDGENPFSFGTSRFIQTEKKGKAFAEWVPTIPETGHYAVYVSYHSHPNSISQAQYLVFHKGGVTEFKVNQQMGGGTWVYLGTFAFDKGNNDYGMVVLTNASKEKGVVSADAVRFGGGMGHSLREGKLSELPRYLEGARYQAQWCGMPTDVYTNLNRKNDYADDINTRANAVNYLSGGSVFNPRNQGLKVPIEMTLALHSDAGYNQENQYIGSLGVYTTRFNQGVLDNGTSRMASRDLTDLVLTQLQNDINKSYETSWTRRSMWDRNYSETRLPGVPSTIIELLSHQNFADMRLGHDPHFKFTASRAIYKGVLRFLATQHHESYTIQPLPVQTFAIEFAKKKRTVSLSWEPQNDPIEPTAKAKGYIVYTRIGYGDFDNGVYVSRPRHTCKLEPGLLYAFKVTAVNEGGESFPSETLVAYQAPKEKSRVLIVNGFNRLSGPAVVDTPTASGFDLNKDPGVPYLYNLSLCGSQLVFDRQKGGQEGEKGLGYSNNELEGMKIAGNTFDFPFVHGKAIQAVAGFSFVSCSSKAVEKQRITLEDYPVVDYLLGLEKEDQAATRYYKTFPTTIQRLLTSYCHSGGNLLVSGSYIGSDMNATAGDQAFTQKLLKYRYQRSIENKLIGEIRGLGRTLTIPREMNEKQYAVTAPEILTPVSPAFTPLVYTPNQESAGVAYKGDDYRTFILGFPFESIESETDRSHLMATILNFFSEK